MHFHDQAYTAAIDISSYCGDDHRWLDDDDIVEPSDEMYVTKPSARRRQGFGKVGILNGAVGKTVGNLKRDDRFETCLGWRRKQTYCEYISNSKVKVVGRGITLAHQVVQEGDLVLHGEFTPVPREVISIRA
jgi:hypothetical protein